MNANFDDDELEGTEDFYEPEKPKRGHKQSKHNSRWTCLQIIIPLIVALIGAIALIIASGNGQVVVTIVNSIFDKNDQNILSTQVASALTQTKIASVQNTPSDSTSTRTPPSLVPPTQLPEVPTITPILPIPNGNLSFSDDFEDGVARGFSFYDGKWTVIDDGAGNKVLQSTADGGSNASFGPSDFSNGIIEFRLRVISFDSQELHNIVQLGFRNRSKIDGDWTEYILAYYLGLSPSVGLSYQEKSGSWQDIEGIYNRVEPIQDLGVDWNTFRVEAQGENIRVFVDGNFAWDAYDSRIKEGALYVGGGLIVQFDDFKVWDISS